MSNISIDTAQQNAVLARVPRVNVPRNTFPLIKKKCTTNQFDTLHPIYIKEILPGDTVNITLSAFARLQTQATDLFDDLYTDYHAWFVPHRLVQTNFDRLFYGAQPTGPTQDNSSLTTPSVIPELVAANDWQFDEKSFYDDAEYPTLVNLVGSTGTAPQHICNYKAREFFLIWNTNYRDQNLQNAVVIDYDEGPDAYATYATLPPRGKQSDFATSCLPFRQKGTAPLVPLGANSIITTGTPFQVRESTAPGTDRNLIVNTGGNAITMSGAAVSGADTLEFGASTGLTLSALTAGFYVNDLRYTVAVQQFLEANARGGTRDVEALLNIWGVEVVDFRMNRPEYLGGSTWRFDGHVVPQTSETGSTPQGTLAEFSQQNSTLKVMHSFVEPGHLFIIASHRGNQSYQGMLKKEDTRRTQYDFLNPFFVHLGEVPMLVQEVACVGTYAQNTATFGWNRYGYEYIHDINTVTREMRSNATNTLDSKHLAYEFASPQSLSSSWIESDTDAINRNIVVDTTVVDPIQLNFKITGSIARQIPLDSIPGLMRL